MIFYILTGIYVFLQLSECNKGHHTPHGYMTHYYFNHRNVEVNDSLVLELTNRFLPDTRKDFLTCDIKIVTSPTRKLLVHFLSLEISDDEEDLDRLHIYDYKANNEAKRISPAQGLYGVYDKYYSKVSGGVSDYVTSGNKLKLDYQGKPTLAYDGFKILITSFRESRGGCGRDYFRCNRKDICIPLSTWCDGYNNCGNNDQSDEANCDQGLANAWKPWDGQITAVVTASVSCLTFLLIAGAIVFVVMRINKRMVINTNITVQFKKKRNPTQKSRNGDVLTRLYAPPSYEVVVGMDEEPPPYDAIDYDTETDDENDILNEHVIVNTEGACVSSPESEIQTDVCITSALVSCDVEGNNIKTAIDKSKENHIHNQNKEFQELTNYKLCSSADSCANSSSNLKKRRAHLQKSDIEDEIEVLDSEGSESSKDENCNSNSPKKYANGNLLGNGHISSQKINGHLKVNYKRSPSKTNSDSIEYMDSD